MATPDIVCRLTERMFGKPLVRNDLRGELVEEIVATALGPEWQLCGGDWAAWDLVRPSDGTRMQVKQSAALQSWTGPGEPVSRPCFSIKSKTYRWEGSVRIADAGRHAEIFVFCWHPRTDDKTDHRDSEQWEFFVVAEHDLPAQQSISLGALKKLANPVGIDRLKSQVEGLNVAK